MCQIIRDFIDEEIDRMSKELTEELTEELIANVTEKVTEEVTASVTASKNAEFIKNLLLMNKLSHPEIAAATGLSLQSVEEIAAQFNA